MGFLELSEHIEIGDIVNTAVLMVAFIYGQ